MYYQYVFINQGSSRSEEPVPVISTAGIHPGTSQEVLKALKSQVSWWDDREMSNSSKLLLPTHTRLEGPQKQEGTFPDLREPEAEVCWKATEGRAGARGGEGKCRGQPEVYCPPLPGLLLGASLCQKLPGSQLAKGPEKCNLPESGWTGKGSRWTQEWAVTSTDTCSSVQVSQAGLWCQHQGEVISWRGPVTLSFCTSFSCSLSLLLLLITEPILKSQGSSFPGSFPSRVSLLWPPYYLQPWFQPGPACWGTHLAVCLHLWFRCSTLDLGFWLLIGGGNGNPLQYSCLENSRDRGACWAPVPRETESDTTNTHAHSDTHSGQYGCIRILVNGLYYVLLPPDLSCPLHSFSSIGPPPSRHQSWPAGSNPLSLPSFSHPKQAFTHLLNSVPWDFSVSFSYLIAPAPALASLFLLWLLPIVVPFSILLPLQSILHINVKMMVLEVQTGCITQTVNSWRASRCTRLVPGVFALGLAPASSAHPIFYHFSSLLSGLFCMCLVSYSVSNSSFG